MDTEARAVLTRAAEWEAQRQAAVVRGDVEAQVAAETELRRLWRRYAEIERGTTTTEP